MTRVNVKDGGEPLAIEFANTRRMARGTPVDLLSGPEAVAEWMAGVGFDLALGEDDVAAFVRLRDAIREIAAALDAGEPEPGDAVATVNAAAAGAPSWPELVDGMARERTEAEPVEAALGMLARSAVEVFGGPDRDAVRICGRWPACVLFFVKNHPRRDYCSPVCGNRARVSRHYERHRESPG
jgi:predicted RNA-binding Zn ribbon-like protein